MVKTEHEDMTSTVAAFAQSEPLAISIALWLSEYRGRNFRLIIEASVKISPQVSAFLDHIGAKIERGNTDGFNLEEVREVFLHTFSRTFEHLESFIKECHEKGVEISCYSDGMKNEYSIEFLRKSKSKRLAFSGWVFDKGGLGGISVEPLPLQRIVDTYQKFSRGQAIAPAGRTSTDLVVLMRYWGQGIYKLRPEISLSEAMFRTIPFNHDRHPENIFVKHDSRMPERETREFMDYCSKHTEAKVHDFSELFSVGSVSDSLPLEMTWVEPTGASCYAFDSTIAIYLAAIGEKDILFTSANSIQGIFSDIQSERTILSYSSIFARLCEKISELGIADPLVVPADQSLPVQKFRT